MLESRRGRRGGVFLKRPSPAGIARQVFPYLAAERATPHSLMWMVWEINVAHLKLAAARLGRMPDSEREHTCERLVQLVSASEEPERWIVLQQALAEIASNPAIDTVARCLVAYQFRLGATLPPMPPSLTSALRSLEHQIITGLRAGAALDAERGHRAAQQLMTDWIASVAPAQQVSRADVN